MVQPIAHFRPGHAGAVTSQQTRELKDRQRGGAAADGIDSFASSKAAATLEGVSSKAFLPQMAQFFGSFAVMPFAWAFGKLGWSKARTYVQAPIAALEALETTRLNSIHQLPANVVKAFGAKAVENNAEGLVASSEALVGKLSAQGVNAAARAEAWAQPVAARMQASGAGIAHSVERSAAGGILDRTVQHVANWRMSSLDKVAANLNVPDAQQASGMWGRVKGFFGGAMNAEMKAVQLAGIAEKQGFWKAAQQGGSGTVLRNLPKALGNTSVGRALLVTGVVTGAAAMLLRTKAENSNSAMLTNELAADLYGVEVSKVTPSMLSGEQAPTLLKRVSQLKEKSVRGNWIAGAAQVAGEGLWLMPNLGIAPAMLVGSSSGFVGDMVKVENPYLTAYGTLKAEAKGQGTLTPEQRAGLVTMLVGAAPAIAEHGGARNKLAKPIAEQMVAENLTVQQIVREVASPDAIEKRAVKAHEAQAAKEAKPAAAVEKTAPVGAQPMQAANENTPQKRVGSIEPQGRVVQHNVAASR